MFGVGRDGEGNVSNACNGCRIQDTSDVDQRLLELAARAEPHDPKAEANKKAAATRAAKKAAKKEPTKKATDAKAAAKARSKGTKDVTRADCKGTKGAKKADFKGEKAASKAAAKATKVSLTAGLDRKAVAATVGTRGSSAGEAGGLKTEWKNVHSRAYHRGIREAKLLGKDEAECKAYAAIKVKEAKSMYLCLD